MGEVAQRSRRWFWLCGIGVVPLLLAGGFLHVAPRVGELAALSEIERVGDRIFRRGPR